MARMPPLTRAVTSTCRGHQSNGGKVGYFHGLRLRDIESSSRSRSISYFPQRFGPYSSSVAAGHSVRRTSKPSVQGQRTFSSQTLSERIPKETWDSHMHVVDPDNYALDTNAQYKPEPHLLSDAMEFYSKIGIKNMVFVQPSIYGIDNSCMLDALRAIGPSRGRAVVTFDPKNIKPSTLEEWHKIGVRGARINLLSVGKTMDPSELALLLRTYAEIIRPFGWILQLYVSLKTADDLVEVIPDLGVNVCLDHFGHPSLPDPNEKSSSSISVDPYDLPGFGSLINLIRQGNAFVKISAPYRISKRADQKDLEPFAKELIRVGGMHSILFATDWPHTRFHDLDIKPYIEKVLEWCQGDEVLAERIFSGNARDLFGAGY